MQDRLSRNMTVFDVNKVNARWKTRNGSYHSSTRNLKLSVYGQSPNKLSHSSRRKRGSTGHQRTLRQAIHSVFSDANDLFVITSDFTDQTENDYDNYDTGFISSIDGDNTTYYQ